MKLDELPETEGWMNGRVVLEEPEPDGVLPLDLRLLQPSEAAALRRLATFREALVVDFGDRPVAVEASPLFAAEPFGAVKIFALQVGPAPGIIGFSEAAVSALSRAVEASPGETPLSTEAGAWILELALAPLLDRLEDALAAPIRFAGLSESDLPATAALSWMALDLKGLGSRPLRVTLGFEPAVTERILDAWPKGSRRRELVKAPVEVSFCLGMTTLRRGELAALGPGDTIVLDQEAFEQEEMAFVMVNGRCIARALAEDRDLKILSTVDPERCSKEEMMMNEEADAVEAPLVEGNSLDDLPVKILFEVGQIRMDFAELASMAPGYVIDLGRPVNAAVDLVVGGRRIGRGDLVRIGQNVGVQVKRLFEH